jgi:low affinity Fe/Cu permease
MTTRTSAALQAVGHSLRQRLDEAGARAKGHGESHPGRSRQHPSKRAAEDGGGSDEKRSAAGGRDLFRKFAHRVSAIVGTPPAFVIAVVVLIVWAASGPVFGFSDTWQLIINTGTTIVTFLMVFLIQTTQNRDAEAIHLKLDELIRATGGARDDLMALEQMNDADLRELEQEFESLRKKACEIRGSKRTKEGSSE